MDAYLLALSGKLAMMWLLGFFFGLLFRAAKQFIEKAFS